MVRISTMRLLPTKRSTGGLVAMKKLCLTLAVLAVASTQAFAQQTVMEEIERHCAHSSECNPPVWKKVESALGNIVMLDAANIRLGYHHTNRWATITDVVVEGDNQKDDALTFDCDRHRMWSRRRNDGGEGTYSPPKSFLRDIENVACDEWFARELRENQELQDKLFKEKLIEHGKRNILRE